MAKSPNTKSGMEQGTDLWDDDHCCLQLSRAEGTRTFLGSLQNLGAQEDSVDDDHDDERII